MIITLSTTVSQQQKENILKKLSSINHNTTEVSTQKGNYIVAVGKGDFDIRDIGTMKGVEDVHIVSDSSMLVSRLWKVHPSSVDLGDGVIVSEDNLTLMAGPCSIESEEQIADTIAHLRKNDVSIMRGGVYKPRSSPYSFRGLGLEGLKMWYKATRDAGIKIISEVMQVSQIEPMIDYVDIFQVGARNTQNFNLLDELGKVDKPVLLKRGISGTIDELLASAEYIFSGGNEKIMLCERGIRTYEKATRNTLDLNAVPYLK